MQYKKTMNNWRMFLNEQLPTDSRVTLGGDDLEADLKAAEYEKMYPNGPSAKDMERAVVRLDQRLDKEWWLEKYRQGEVRRGDTGECGAVCSWVLGRISDLMSIFNPFDFIVNWLEGGFEDMLEYEEDFRTAIGELDFIRAISAWQCGLVTAIGLLPGLSKGRKAVKITSRMVREIDLAVDGAIFFARAAAGVFVAAGWFPGGDEFKKQGQKLNGIIDNVEKQIESDREVEGDVQFGQISVSDEQGSEDTDPDNVRMDKRPRGRNQ